MFKAKLFLWLFSIFKIPLIGFCRPRLLFLDDERSVIRIRLSRRTKNHLGSMYFGGLAIGADLAGAFHAFYIVKERGKKASIAFKDFNAEFLRRPEADVYFESNSGKQIVAMLDKSEELKERVTEQVEILAKVKTGDSEEVVAKFQLGLSIKVK